MAIEKIKKWNISQNHISGIVYRTENGKKKKIYVSGEISYQRGDIIEIGAAGSLVPLKCYKLS